MITFSVGANGKNFHPDVMTIQALLKAKGYDPGLVDGICGQKTIKAIKAFQSSFLKQPDGTIEPNRASWMKLSAIETPSANSSLKQWDGDSSLWSQDKKIQSLTPELRPKVKAVLEALKRRGFSPVIFFGWRSVAVQLKLHSSGNSKVKFSFHNAQQPNGTPKSYAADIIDSRYSWSKQAETSGFWKALGEVAKTEGLHWGGDWASFRDWAHVQLLPNSELGRIKRESGL